MIKQDNFLDVTNKIVEKGMIGHAYLIQVGQNYDRQFLYKFVKKIVSTFNVTDEIINDIYNRIDNDCFADLIVITPEKQAIKKTQIIDLQENFKTKSEFNEKRFYIIEFAENFNLSAFNTLLKFLEEPENDIVAMLVTKNINLVPETIVSRCQLLNLIKETSFDKEYNVEEIERAYKYLLILLDKKKRSIPFLYELYNFDVIKIKDILQIWISILFQFIKKEGAIFKQLNLEQSDIMDKYDLSNLTKLIHIIDSANNNLNNNYNNRLMLDDIIIEMFGVDNNV